MHLQTRIQWLSQASTSQNQGGRTMVVVGTLMIVLIPTLDDYPILVHVPGAKKKAPEITGFSSTSHRFSALSGDLWEVGSGWGRHRRHRVVYRRSSGGISAERWERVKHLMREPTGLKLHCRRSFSAAQLGSWWILGLLPGFRNRLQGQPDLNHREGLRCCQANDEWPKILVDMFL